MFMLLLTVAAQAGAPMPDVRLRQVGAVAAPGKAQTLRCTWRAAAPDGRVVEGSRPGWCAQSERAIRAEAGARLGR